MIKSLITALLLLSACQLPWAGYWLDGLGPDAEQPKVFYCEKRVNLPPVCAPAAMLDAYPEVRQIAATARFHCAGTCQVKLLRGGER